MIAVIIWCVIILFDYLYTLIYIYVFGVLWFRTSGNWWADDVSPHSTQDDLMVFFCHFLTHLKDRSWVWNVAIQKGHLLYMFFLSSYGDFHWSSCLFSRQWLSVHQTCLGNENDTRTLLSCMQGLCKGLKQPRFQDHLVVSQDGAPKLAITAAFGDFDAVR